MPRPRKIHSPDFSPRRLTAARLKNLMAVAAGRRPADLIIRNVDRFNVHLPRLETNQALAIVGDRIAAVGPEAEKLAGPDTRIMDGGGRLALPGFIDAHTHLDSTYTVREFARLALASGNTTSVSETAMAAGAAGAPGVAGFMAEARGLPLRVFFLAPPVVPPFPDLETSAGLDLKSFKAMINQPDVLGSGEAYWRPVLDLDPEIMDRLALVRAAGKSLEGHAAGARGLNLQAYRAGGIGACHESTTAKEALERLSLGMTVQIREGYVRSELAAMAPLTEIPNLDYRRLILCTDLASPQMLTETGVMNELVRRAVAVGFDPLRAVQMVTLNPAEHFGLSDLGRLDPGALADVVLVDGLNSMNVDLVMVGGRVVAENGRVIVPLPETKYPPSLCRSFALDRVEAKDFRLKAPSGPVKVRAVAVVNETITREEIVETRSVRGRIAADPDQDLVKIAVFNKHEKTPTGAVGLARGLGFQSGAAAVSLIWDANNLLVMGVTDAEMALAANRVLEHGGGVVVVRGRRILAEMPLPAAGIISEEPFETVRSQWVSVEKAVAELGSELTRPFLTFQTFCFTGLPFLRLTDKGLADVRTRRLVPVLV